ncbi:MAG: exodeoxyribonuclease VII large subunit [Clostridia bacterium]|jgi:exodeoxyribonuclease VII large subunit
MDKSLTVSQLNEYINKLITSDDVLESLNVEGEISNCTIHYSGHIYFSIKDDKCSIRCVMFAGSTKNLKFKPEDGVKVCVYGYLSFYEKSGQCQIIVTNMLESGAGDLFVKFEKLKKKLAEEGLFDTQRKKKLPYLPETVGVITSSTGAVLQDIRNILSSRFPNYGLLLYPATVQGSGAHKTIIEGLSYFNEYKNADVIIIARGGGSVEDLWPFNEEELAYAIYDSRIPVISAVGHETDFTIADFVADARAATPTAAAQMVIPEKSMLIKDITAQKYSLETSYSKFINNLTDKVQNLSQRPVMKRPDEYTNIMAMNLDNLTNQFFMFSKTYLDNIRYRLNSSVQKMDALNPLAVLSRGYSITTDENGNVIKNSNSIKMNDVIMTRFYEGNIRSLVEKVDNNE